MMKNTKTQRLTRCAVLTALSLALSLLDRMIPLNMVVPVPGIRLGLSNIVVMGALQCLTVQDAFSILLCRVLLTLLLSGNVTAFALSLSGGVFAFCVMILLSRMGGRWFSLFGISVGGACAHNFGQLMAAAFLMNTGAVFGYLPILLVTGTVSGLLTAVPTQIVCVRVKPPRL